MGPGGPGQLGEVFLPAQNRTGDPKNRRLLEYIAEHKEAKKRMLQVESELMRDKRLQELEEGLLYTISEKEHNVDFTEEGQAELSKRDKDLFVIPDLEEACYEIDRQESLSLVEKEQRKAQLRQQYEESEG